MFYYRAATSANVPALDNFGLETPEISKKDRLFFRKSPQELHSRYSLRNKRHKIRFKACDSEDTIINSALTKDGNKVLLRILTRVSAIRADTCVVKANSSHDRFVSLHIHSAIRDLLRLRLWLKSRLGRFFFLQSEAKWGYLCLLFFGKFVQFV